MKTNKWKTLFFMILIIFANYFLITSVNPLKNGGVEEPQTEDSRKWIGTLNEAGGNWSTTELVSTECNGASSSPAIVIDAENNLHVVWAETINNNTSIDTAILYKCWDASTQSWSSIEVLSIHSSMKAGDPTIAVDNEGDIHVTWSDDTSQVYYKRYNATTKVWASNRVIYIPEFPLRGYQTPAITVDRLGNVHIAFTLFRQDLLVEPYLYCSHWNAILNNWYFERISTCGSLFPTIAVDSAQNIHIVTIAPGLHGLYHQLGKAIIDCRYYDWAKQEIDPSTYILHPVITVDCFDNIHLVWSDYIYYRISYKCWNNTTRTWGITQTIFKMNSNYHKIVPTIAADGKGNVHVAWGGNELFYKCWNATTGLWGASELISTERTGKSNNPAIAVGTDGSIYVVWSDAINQSGAGNDYDIFYKRKLIYDNISPQYNTLRERPIDALYLPNQQYQFNCSWRDNIAVKTVLFEFNGINYTQVMKARSEYYYKFLDLPANPSGYTFRWFAKDFSGNWNNTPTKVYVINQRAPNFQVLLNGTNGNCTVSQGDYINISITLLEKNNRGNFILFINGNYSDSRNSTNHYETFLQFPKAGIYNISCYFYNNPNLTNMYFNLLNQLLITPKFTSEEFLEKAIIDLIDKIESSPAVSWQEPTTNRKQTMIAKLNAIKDLIGTQNFEEAYDNLLHDIKPKLTGLKTDENEEPWGNGIFNNPWVTGCDLQEAYRLTCNEILTRITSYLTEI